MPFWGRCSCARNRGREASELKIPGSMTWGSVGLCPLVWAVGFLACRHEPSARAEGASRSEASARLEPTSAPATIQPSASVPSPPVPPPDPENRSKPPLTSADLSSRSELLLLAIQKNEPRLADEFFFPKEPFIPLKDVADPARYFDQLIATYHRDIAHLHGQRKDWTTAHFVSFELGSPPGWVAPGKEYNKIGYYRTFHGKLRY